MTTITKRIEFDAGHRVPDHASKCKNPHGHRYALEVEVYGEVIDEPGNPANGMVIDFAALKAVMVEQVDDLWDHAFIVADDDVDLREFLCSRGWKVDVLPCVPTAENLVRIATLRLLPRLRAEGIRLLRVQLWETPTCSATYFPNAADRDA